MVIDFHTHIFPDKIAARTIEKLENIASVKAFTDGREERFKLDCLHEGGRGGFVCGASCSYKAGAI